MSEIDLLTGCLRKEAIEGTLDRLKAECDAEGYPLSILVIDLDNFKSYNDKYGHLKGDEALKYFASTLRLSMEESDHFIFRFGGDEFLVVFPEKSPHETYLIANGIKKNLKIRPFLSKGHLFKMTFSGGIASYPSDGHNIEDLFKNADKAMYFSKTHGHKKTTLYKHIAAKKIASILRIIALILVAAAVFFYFQKSYYRDLVVGWVKEKINAAAVILTRQFPSSDGEGFDTIYLKSGRMLKGIIIRDGKDEIEINLRLKSGMGSVTIKKSEIKEINMWKKGSERSAEEKRQI